MIKSVTITNHVGDTIKMELTRPELSGFAIRKIDGLGPVKSNINITDVATHDGGLYNSARLTTRNIVFDLVFINNYGETIEDIRHRAYKYFPTKSNIKILIETTNRLLETEGYVESNDPAIFSKQEGCTVSVICPNSYFYAVNESNKFTFSSIEPLFEFPFSNESLSEPMLEMSSIKLVYEGLLIYRGDTETGVKITLHADGPVENVTIYNTGTREKMFINTYKLAAITGESIKARDEIIINTVKGNNYIRLLRDGKYYNIINCLDRNANWFQLSSGDNTFAYTAEYGANNLKFTIENEVIYKGV